MEHRKMELKTIGKVILVIAAIAGFLLSNLDAIRSRMRQSVSDKAIAAAEKVISDGGGEVEFTVPITDFLAVDGEDGEDDTSLEDVLREMGDTSSEHETLSLIGILEIPCIDVKEPIWDSCSSTALRYGVGRFPQTCNIGEPANCTIFGHRMRQSKTIFWQLQTLEKHIGEEVIVITTDGVKHVYTIDSVVYATDAEIDPFLNASLYDSEHLCLATCGYGQDPYRSDIYRAKNTEFFVICVPETD